MGIFDDFSVHFRLIILSIFPISQRSKGLRFHDLRHTFATRLIEHGVNLITVKELRGHSSVEITQRYTHPNETLKKDAVAALVAPAPADESLLNIYDGKSAPDEKKRLSDLCSTN